MIDSKIKLIQYLAADAKANGVKLKGLKNKLRNSFNPTWQFIVALRKYELAKNKRKAWMIPLLLWRWYNYHRLSVKLGFTIPPNVVESGLSLPHYGNIIINPACRIGRNCRIHVGVNIGASGGSIKAPIVGDNVYIAPGAKLFGDIRIGNGCFVAANSVVNKSFPDNCVLAGMPAVSKKLIEQFWWQQNGLNL